jgi:hypothetical protein
MSVTTEFPERIAMPDSILDEIVAWPGFSRDFPWFS